MKTIGLIGGMTWHSTLDYYRFLNEDVHRRLGGSHCASIVMTSVDFDEIEKLQVAGDWERLTVLMTDAALKTEAAGADLLLICANTMHRTADKVAAALSIPLVHIADATAAEIRRQGLKTVGLLGTRYTMEMDFYKGRLEKKTRPERSHSRRKPAGRGPRHHLQGARPGTDSRQIPGGVPEGHRRPSGPRGRGRHPRLHGDPAADKTDGFADSGF